MMSSPTHRNIVGDNSAVFIMMAVQPAAMLSARVGRLNRLMERVIAVLHSLVNREQAEVAVSDASQGQLPTPSVCLQTGKSARDRDYPGLARSIRAYVAGGPGICGSPRGPRDFFCKTPPRATQIKQPSTPHSLETKPGAQEIRIER